MDKIDTSGITEGVRQYIEAALVSLSLEEKHEVLSAVVQWCVERYFEEKSKK